MDGRPDSVSGGLVDVTRPGERMAVLTLRRPQKKNALSIALRDAVSARLAELSADDSISAVILTGAGGTFSAGFDLDEFGALDDQAHADRLWRSADAFHRALLTCPLPLIAAVEGVAYAGGFDLAVLCDLRVAGRSARFAHPEAAFGDVMYGPLRELLGGAIARELVLSGRVVDAEEALRLGLVTRLTDDGHALASAVEVAGEVVKAPREILLRTVDKIRRRTGIAMGDRVGGTLDL